MFVRFVVGRDAENAAWLTGVIPEARLLRDRGELYGYESERLEARFNEHLPCPAFENYPGHGRTVGLPGPVALGLVRTPPRRIVRVFVRNPLFSPAF